MGINTFIARNLILFSVLIVSTALASTNHTVGGNAGWFFNATTNSSATNYTSWAAKQTFSLGDLLIFNTNSKQIVIETYNKTIYQSCTYKNSTNDDDNTIQYDGGGGKLGEALTIEVPLTIQGSTYYFSNTGDKVQCQRGMAFQIQVGNGDGFLPDLNYAPPPPPGNGVFRISRPSLVSQIVVDVDLSVVAKLSMSLSKHSLQSHLRQARRLSCPIYVGCVTLEVWYQRNSFRIQGITIDLRAACSRISLLASEFSIQISPVAAMKTNVADGSWSHFSCKSLAASALEAKT
ncbi:hypothetical protein F8388_006764 [Cannabis sativa]|uniref:Phytocyanin domain-containing protein n=1 Tax=Cannabis sativa TaxID=3483 RepID=A0A7J6GXG4_CANSA|nr:hypothetical protein F8388_006764 [Cannabis sativa]KAF4397889.1 hypothetical protein G4B88_019610 [Cannabis sativa]